MLLLISPIIMLATRDCDVSKLADGDFLRGFAIMECLYYSYHCPGAVMAKKHFSRAAIIVTALSPKRDISINTMDGGLWVCF